MGFLSKIFDPGEANRDQATALAQEGVIRGGSTTGPGGVSAGFDFSSGQATANFGLGSFQTQLTGLQGLSEAGLNQAREGLPGQFTGVAGDTQDRLGQIDVSQLQNQGDFAGLGDIFKEASATAQRDPFELGAGIADKLRAIAERRQNRQISKTFDRLKRSGKLGTTGGAGIAAELEQNIFDQDLQFDLAGLQQGQAIQQSAFQRAMGASAGREAIGGRQFGESFALENLGGNRALQQFGIEQASFDAFLRSQAQGANIGVVGAQAAAGVAQLPLAFQQALLASGSQASNSLFAASGVNLQAAAQAKSPFLEALNAAGSFASSVGVGVS